MLVGIYVDKFVYPCISVGMTRTKTGSQTAESLITLHLRLKRCAEKLKVTAEAMDRKGIPPLDAAYATRIEDTVKLLENFTTSVVSAFEKAEDAMAALGLPGNAGIVPVSEAKDGNSRSRTTKQKKNPTHAR